MLLGWAAKHQISTVEAVRKVLPQGMPVYLEETGSSAGCYVRQIDATTMAEIKCFGSEPLHGVRVELDCESRCRSTTLLERLRSWCLTWQQCRVHSLKVHTGGAHLTCTPSTDVLRQAKVLNGFHTKITLVECLARNSLVDGDSQR